MVAGVQPELRSVPISIALTPPSAQAQRQISAFTPMANVWSGAGETITDSGAMGPTGTVAPVDCPAVFWTGSLYQRVVNGPAARASASVSRVNHFTLFVP